MEPTEDSNLGYSHYALLIGIDAYPEKPLKGCVRDVHRIKTQLESIAEPRIVHIRTLTASLTNAELPSQTMAEPESLPTRRSVIDALDWIIAGAKEGDFVYIHYSGHGTACRLPIDLLVFSKFSNRTTGDLGLNLLPGNGSNIKYLWGSELATSLSIMVEKKSIVTVVLDCCFSGSVMRNDDSVRYRA